MVMIASARSKNASMTSSSRSWQRCSRLKALCQALCPLDVPALPGLDGCLVFLTGDLAGLWRPVTPQAPDDQEGRFFESVLIARPGY
jgi:hypothetical protein